MRTLAYAPEEPRGLRGVGVRLAERFSGRGGVRSSAVTGFYRDLATMLDAGIGIRQAFDTLLRQASSASPEFYSAVREMRDHIADGGTLGEAMARRPDIFDPLEVRAVEVGEQAGVLEDSLGRLANLREYRSRLRRRVIGALTYPAMVVVIATLITLFLMTFVVPTLIEPIIRDGQALPLPTRIVKTASDMLLYGWWALLLGLIAGIFLFRRWIATSAGRRQWHMTLLKLPVVGGLLLKASIARAATIISTLLRSGIGLVEAVGTAAEGCGNMTLRDAFYDWQQRLDAGEEPDRALAATRAFPALMVEMVAVGAQSGKMEAMLDKLAETYEQQTNDTAERLAAIVEPALIVILAGLVLLIALAVLLPILQLGSVFAP